jgi:hypothetical protein
MALMDQVQRMEQQVAQRLQELEPLVSEYEELKKVAERLGLSSSNAAPAPADRRTGGASSSPATAAATTKRARPTSRTRTRRRSGGRRNAAAPGSRQQDVVRLVSERPGISVSEIGKELGVDPTGLYQIVRRLEARGEIRKEGKALRVAGGTQAAPAD